MARKWYGIEIFLGEMMADGDVKLNDKRTIRKIIKVLRLILERENGN